VLVAPQVQASFFDNIMRLPHTIHHRCHRCDCCNRHTRYNHACLAYTSSTDIARKQDESHCIPFSTARGHPSGCLPSTHVRCNVQCTHHTGRGSLSFMQHTLKYRVRPCSHRCVLAYVQPSEYRAASIPCSRHAKRLRGVSQGYRHAVSITRWTQRQVSLERHVASGSVEPLG
jgi:hypothetical protein